MATEALDPSSRTFGIRLAGRPILWRLRVLLRQWRRERSRRRWLSQVLAETSDPRIIAEAGFQRPGAGFLELWARALLAQYPMR